MDYLAVKGRLWLLALAGLGLAGCAETPAPASPQPQPAWSAQAAPASATPSDASVPKTNLPSAPPDTPLCGTALREQAAMGAALYDKSLTSGNDCTRNACFQPLTGTFIAQDGTNSVCR